MIPNPDVVARSLHDAVVRACEAHAAGLRDRVWDQFCRIEKLEAALAWAIEHGATNSSVNPEIVYGDGCGCCADVLIPPAELIPYIEAAGRAVAANEAKEQK